MKRTMFDEMIEVANRVDLGSKDLYEIMNRTFGQFDCPGDDDVISDFHSLMRCKLYCDSMISYISRLSQILGDEMMSSRSTHRYFNNHEE